MNIKDYIIIYIIHIKIEIIFGVVDTLSVCSAL